MARSWVLISTALLVVTIGRGQAETSSPDRFIVDTKDGRISGMKKTSHSGKEYYSFQAIPYAKPPVGDLRFRDPVPSKGWEGVRDGGVAPPVCGQIEWFKLVARNYTFTGAEDCLMLNVFTRKPGQKSGKQAVMVYIHSGGFIAGGADLYPSENIMDQDVVLVTIQYRLGILGFLSTEDSVIPGNFGLKDQTMALRWVQKNIENFGGDPGKVTLFGNSAGGASVHFHYLSPYSEGLFTRGISQSGSLLCPWAKGAAYKEVAQFTGRLFGCPETKEGITSGEASKTLLECLQKVDYQELALSIRHHVTWNYNPALVAPRVDYDYIPNDPETLMRQGRHKKADLMSGITRHEGGIFTLPLYDKNHGFMKTELMENFDEVGPESLDLRREDEDPVRLAKHIFDQYAGGVTVSEDVADELCEMYGERQFKLAHDWTSQLHARNVAPNGGRTFTYTLTHRGNRGLPDFYAATVGSHWVAHFDAVFYLFPGDDVVWGRVKGEEDERFGQLLTTLWVNYANTGNPTPDNSLGFKWEPATPDNFQSLNLKPNPVMQPDNRQKVRAFWESLPTHQNKLLNPDKVISFSPLSLHKKTVPKVPTDLPHKPRKYTHTHTEL